MHRRPAIRIILALTLLVALGLGSCSLGGGGDDAAPSTTTTVPTSTSAPSTTTSTAPTTSTLPPSTTTTTEPEPEWVVGAQPLPLRPDGFGEILPTPEVLVDRSLPTHSDLPPPPDDGYHSTISEIDDEIRERMGETWHPDCPVGLEDLRYLTMSFWGFAGGHHTGEMIVHASVAEDVVSVFERLHEARFPIEEMRIVTTADLHAPATGDGNTTAAFVCRSVRAGSSWSEHAKGLAIDLNPFQNPYVRGDIVVPELASAYLDREWHRRGMVQPGDLVTEAFADIGWSWGGEWSSPDLMHFSLANR